MTSLPSPFKSPTGEAVYLSAYDDAMKSWPIPFEERTVSSRFGLTHVVVSGPLDAPPLVLLHGFWATLTMWSPNIADFAMGHRVYAVDVMGQPGRSVPAETIRSRADHVEWLSATLDGLGLDRASLVGMSYGGWLALNYAIAMPERVESLVLLSPAASLLPLVRQFSLRGMLMVLVPSRFTINSFMRWLSLTGGEGDAESQRTGQRVLDLMYLGLRHFRVPRDGAVPTVFSDSELRALRVATLLLIGEREVIYDPAAALTRARRLISGVEAELVPRSSHEMSFSQWRLVDARIAGFLRRSHARRVANTREERMARQPVSVP